jgi:hypothetical protein
MTFDQKGNLVPQSENNFPLSSQDTNAERQQAKKKSFILPVSDRYNATRITMTCKFVLIN